MIEKKLMFVAFIVLLGLTACSSSKYARESMARTVYNTSTSFPSNQQPYPSHNREQYKPIQENGFKFVSQSPQSTFSVDVDTASYANIRRIINEGRLPPSEAVRIEEMINYFDYQYASPQNDDPFAISTEVGVAPWNQNHKIVQVGIQAKKVNRRALPPSNLVFLIDVSGSMQARLPMVKASLRQLVKQLRKNDRVAIVVYAGAAGMVLPSTSGPKMENQKSDKSLRSGRFNGGC